MHTKIVSYTIRKHLPFTTTKEPSPYQTLFRLFLSSFMPVTTILNFSSVRISEKRVFFLPIPFKIRAVINHVCKGII